VEKRGIRKVKETDVIEVRYIMTVGAGRETEQVLQVGLVDSLHGKEGNMISGGLERLAMAELQEHPGFRK
jgi:hypothetical protein